MLIRHEEPTGTYAILVNEHHVVRDVIIENDDIIGVVLSKRASDAKVFAELGDHTDRIIGYLVDELDVDACAYEIVHVTHHRPI